jgi:uncharacterized protein (TIGR02246 family)
MGNRLRVVAGLAALAAVAAGCSKGGGGQQSDNGKTMASAATERVDTAAAAAEIRGGDEQFFNAVKKRDANAIAELYAEDAISMPPNSPPLRGRDAIRKYNEEFVKLPKLTISGGPETIAFSSDGSMAYEAGKYSVSFADPKGRTVRDDGKFLNVLRREEGKWKVVADAFSSNAPPPK